MVESTPTNTEQGIIREKIVHASNKEPTKIPMTVAILSKILVFLEYLVPIKEAPHEKRFKLVKWLYEAGARQCQQN
jgi:hypothetical protein